MTEYSKSNSVGGGGPAPKHCGNVAAMRRRRRRRRRQKREDEWMNGKMGWLNRAICKRRRRRRRGLTAGGRYLV